MNDDTLKFDDNGLIPAVVQSPEGEVRMLAWMNGEALARTRASGFVTFWSRSRQALWTKGESSGNRLRVRTLAADCDGDTLLVVAEPEGPTCHCGTESCFDGEGAALPALPWLGRLEAQLRRRRASANLEGSYTQKLFARGAERIGKKVVEEAGEVALAALALEHRATPERRAAFVDEAADLLFHLQALLVSQGHSLVEVAECLRQRHREG
ncbi:MAG TPA: bifunctional phosphoribosyl-AMP cyclohydrolase/phosphoribosyl-ATP diphosphatase HisIE [Holophaga sp.]|nr:bifunctional phosphoribosyl-AMP cyclohydrolase/phosphoribosyl-ATP diphosphatase HisIE [Holophaga sp.]